MSKMPADYKRKYRVPASYVFLLRDQKFFVLKRSNTGWMDGVFTIPSGHVEEDETFLQAAVRETYEEAGVRLKPENLRFVHLCDRDEEKNDRVWDDAYFVCADFEGEPYNSELEKASEGGWFEYANPPKDLMIPAVYHVLQQIKQGNYYSAFPGN